MNIRETSMPRASQTFVEFAQLLRAHGFAVAPDQTTSFIEAIARLGPRDLGDIRRAGLALLAVPNERQPEYDALFRAFFMGQTLSAPSDGEEEDDLQAYEPQDDQRLIEVEGEETDAGELASMSEILSSRQLTQIDEDNVLRDFVRRAPAALPRRRSYRRTPARKGDAFDMRRSLRQAVRRDGELFELARNRRKTRLRPITLLIDVSGSMKEQSDATMRFAHALASVADRLEAFTFGTRLTRITRALQDKNAERSMQRIGAAVADFDGGTRIGDALDALLAVPRFAGTMRGASVIVLSDGLERGAPDLMVDTLRRIARIAWRVDWLSPLAADPGYEPRTQALSAARQYLDSLSAGHNIEAIALHVLGIAGFQNSRWAGAT